MTHAETAHLLEGDTQWGSIQDVLEAPLIGLEPDSSWLSVVLMWLMLPFNLIQGLCMVLCKCGLVTVTVGHSCIPCSETFSVLGSVRCGRPFFLAWVWWRYMIGGMIALFYNGKSRLALFLWEWEMFGRDRCWWHGEGVWMWTYKDCERILKSQQRRRSAFGAVSASIPDLFATNLLIFMSNEGGSDSEWAAMRQALHTHLLDLSGADYTTRLNDMRLLVAQDWPNPKVEDFNDVALLNRLVAKCVFFMIFNKWLDNSEALILTGWRTNALMFILPRLVHRFMFNWGIKQVKFLRQTNAYLIERYDLKDFFIKMNNSLPPKYRRPTLVKLCDEIMYVVGFAGIQGTCAAVESCAAFFQCKIPQGAAGKHISFGEYSTPERMHKRFLADPETYIREVLRMDPPATSATSVLKEATEVVMGGRKITLDAGMYQQYVLSMANRDESVFPDPGTFDPNRPNLNKALTWNGAFGAEDEAEFPRICPGRFLSVDITKAILAHGLDDSDLVFGRTFVTENKYRGGACC